ncbi:uncharacterized protein LOC123896697 [Trifolium pratense]|uniref:uncharacterized protein LOC123896697 n=1 Tax=Trifolium pratense TaxID=57577 RepID=UPI001E696515|nr:uncharacterized protein LOC123896697 [Trifolium pratense]
MPVTLDFMKEFGCVRERDCPYLKCLKKPSQHRGYRKSWCRPASDWMVVVKVDEWKKLYFEEMFDHLREAELVICRMEWTPRILYTGERGVKYPTMTNEDGVVQTNIHFLVIVGYGIKWIQNDLVTYYTVRNSTGTEWSNNGYRRIEAKEDLFSCFWDHKNYSNVC